MIDFWNHNLNGITLFSKSILVKEENRSRNRNIKENYLKADNLTGYILTPERLLKILQDERNSYSDDEM